MQRGSRSRPGEKKSVRLQIVEELGGRCMWAGGCDVDDPDVLQIDHVYGNNRQHWERLGGRVINGVGGGRHYTGAGTVPYYNDILSTLNTGEYQLLCANHHAKKHAIERRCKQWKGEPPCPFAA